MLRGWLERWRRRRAPQAVETPAADVSVRRHEVGRAHLVFDDGSIVEADMDPETRAKVEYLARRAVAPPPPKD